MPNADFVAGISAGAVTTLVMHPLDLIKVRLQVDDYYKTSSSSASSTNVTDTAGKGRWPAFLGTTGRVGRIWSSFTSYKDLYRGLGINLVGNTVSWGLYFALYNELKRDLIPQYAGGGRPNSGDGGRAAAGEKEDEMDQKSIQHLYLACALIAGTTTSFLTNPLWVLKTRQLGTTRQQAVSGSVSGYSQGLVSIIKNEGVKALWRGFVPGLFGVVQSSLQFTIYEDMKVRRLRHHNQQNLFREESQQGQVEQLPTIEYLSISAVSKIVATVALYPYQLVRSRMQMPLPTPQSQSQSQSQQQKPNKASRGTVKALDVLATTVKTEGGVLALYKGLGANLVRVVPGTCITFLVYEKVKLFMN